MQIVSNTEEVVQRCSAKKVFLEISQNSQQSTCARVSFLIKLQGEACNFIKKETLAHVFSCEFCGISKNTFFTEHFWTTVSKLTQKDSPSIVCWTATNPQQLTCQGLVG